MNKHREAKESRLSPKLLAGIIVALFFGVALCFRICLPYDQVFSGDWIKFTGADGYYHMRLIDNLVHNFPHLISTDPYMLHPGAVWITRIHFFDWLLASIIWVIGLGSPTQHTIDIVGAYFPAVLGALTVIPVYFIGKEIFNRWVGVISAGLIAFMPGEFLGRSILGFTDHDVAGTLFTTVTIMFLILAVKAARQRGLTFSHFQHGDRAAITRPIIYSLLTGIFLGIYLVTWEGALLFVLIIFAYFVIQFIIDHLRQQSTDYLCPVGVITFLIALLMFLPAAHEKLSPVALVIALLIPLVLSGISRLLTSRQIKPFYYPIAVVGLGAIGLAIFRVISISSSQVRAIFNSMFEAIGVLSPQGVALTTLEMQPLTANIAWANFTTGFFLSFIALGILIYLVIKRDSSEKSLLIVWSLITLVLALGQRRFATYLAINVALLAGYLSTLGFFVVRSIIAHLRNEPTTYLSRRILESPNPGELLTTPTGTTPPRTDWKKARAKKSQQNGFRITVRHTSLVLSVLVIFCLVFLPNIIKGTAEVKQLRFAPSNAWCQSLDWLKANTTDPFGNPDYYYEFYEPGTSPAPDYTVTAWWDYGYWITRIAHRVPNTNPAQGGVRRVANFLLAQDEDAANEARKGLGSSYVIIDYETVTGKFWAIATWAKKEPTEFSEIYYLAQGDNLAPIRLFYPEYYYSLAIRLYTFDGKAVTPRSATVISYRERLTQEGEIIKEITESKPFDSYEEAAAYLSSQPATNYRLVSADPFSSPVPLDELTSYQLAYSSDIFVRQPQGGMVPAVKIFACQE